jgi:hypothetical protein
MGFGAGGMPPGVDQGTATGGEGDEPDRHRQGPDAHGGQDRSVRSDPGRVGGEMDGEEDQGADPQVGGDDHGGEDAGPGGGPGNEQAGDEHPGDAGDGHADGGAGQMAALGGDEAVRRGGLAAHQCFSFGLASSQTGLM